MKNIIRNALKVILFSQLAMSYIAQAEDSKEELIALEKMSELYEKHGCQGLVEFSHEQKKIYELMSLSDIFHSLSQENSKSYSGSLVGNIRVTSLRRKINDNYLNLNYYSKRGDIKKLIKEDLNSIDSEFTNEEMNALINYLITGIQESGEARRIISKTKEPLASITNDEAASEINQLFEFILSCGIYEMIFVENSSGDLLLGQYLVSLANSSRNININKLNEILNQ